MNKLLASFVYICTFFFRHFFIKAEKKIFTKKLKTKLQKITDFVFLSTLKFHSIRLLFSRFFTLKIILDNTTQTGVALYI